jgi:hypothetical protein
VALCAAAVVIAVDADGAEVGPRLKHQAEGSLADVSGGVASGTFNLKAYVRDGGSESPKVVIRVEGMDGTRDDDGERPPYGGFVVDAGGNDVFVGRVRVNHQGNGRLRLTGARGLFEGQDMPLRGFGGGRVEVRLGTDVILSGTIPEFELIQAGTSRSRSEIYGNFTPYGAPNHRPGTYALRTNEFESGEIRNRIVVKASGVLTGRNPPTYSVRLINAAGNRFVTLGNMDPHPDVGATLVMDSRSTTIPGGIVRWSEFNGGLIQVRRGSTLMLEGDITPILEADNPQEPVGDARFRETVELFATSGEARGLFLAELKTLPRRRIQEMRCRIEDVDPAAGPYTCSVIVGGATRNTLATFKVKGAASIGGFRLSTREGDPIPRNFVLQAQGGPIEVTDAAGNVVLTGTFPTFK